MLTNEMLPLLWCPSCRSGGLALSAGGDLTEGSLVCENCQTDFPVHDGVPDLIPHDQLDSEEWKTWEGHLSGFSGRRDIREKKPSPAQHKRWAKKQGAFAAFLDVPAGFVLDIGCGPGGIREDLDLERTSYVGIDPIPTSAVEDFCFARAIAEYIPFRDHAFAGLIARSALDHFCDLRGFFKEAARVLQPGGVVFVEQAIHGEGGLKGAIKSIVHETKDFLDDLKTSREAREAPKHMTDFTAAQLLEAAGEFFEVERTEKYDPNPLAATQFFVALRRKG